MSIEEVWKNNFLLFKFHIGMKAKVKNTFYYWLMKVQELFAKDFLEEEKYEKIYIDVVNKEGLEWQERMSEMEYVQTVNA